MKIDKHWNLSWYAWISLSFDFITFILCDFFSPNLTHRSINSGLFNASIQPYSDSTSVSFCLRAFLFRFIIEAAELFLVNSVNVLPFHLKFTTLTLSQFYSRYLRKLLYSFSNRQIEMILAKWCISDLISDHINGHRFILYRYEGMNNSTIV